MVDKEYLKEIISNSESDILFTKFIGLLENDDEIVYEPKGLFNRGILKDTGRVTKGRDNLLFIEINRPGLYDVMPKGLFHDKLDDINNQEEYFDKIEKERKVIRKLFLPFDSTYFSAIASIEKENAKHFQNKFDSEIAFELLKFYQIFEEFDFLSIIEILAIDFFKQQKSKKDKIDLTDKFIPSVLPLETDYKSIIVKMMEYCQGDSMLIRFLDVVPYCSRFNADLDKIQKILKYIFNVNFFVRKEKIIEQITINQLENNLLDNREINSSDKSFVLGGKFYDEIDKVFINIELSDDNMFIMNRFQTGSINKLLSLFISFFLPVHFEYEIQFCTNNSDGNVNNHSDFKLESNQDKLMDLEKLEESIRKYLSAVAHKTQWYDMSPGTEIRMELIDYLNLFYLITLNEDANYTYLSMNTKI